MEIHRGFAAGLPDAFAPELASPLNNLGDCLAATGNRDAALHASTEAMELYRGIGTGALPALRAEYALALDSFCHNLSACSHRPEAAAAIGEAVDIYRNLAAFAQGRSRPLIRRLIRGDDRRVDGVRAYD